MSLAFHASPIDFNINDNIENKRKEAQKTKLNHSLLEKISKKDKIEDPKQEEINNIHNNLKEENNEILSDFYNNEMQSDLKTEIAKKQYQQDSYNNENINTDYLISNNLNTNKITLHNKPQNDILLTKLNQIIEMFEEQKEIKTNQKKEETILYCFLGIFVIYVLDSFVYIGKYKR